MSPHQKGSFKPSAYRSRPGGGAGRRAFVSWVWAGRGRLAGVVATGVGAVVGGGAEVSASAAASGAVGGGSAAAATGADAEGFGAARDGPRPAIDSARMAPRAMAAPAATGPH